MVQRLGWWIVIGVALWWNVARYTAVEQMLRGEPAPEIRYSKSGLPHESPTTVTILRRWGANIQSLFNKSRSVEDTEETSKADAPRASSPPAGSSWTTGDDLLPPLPQNAMPLPTVSANTAAKVSRDHHALTASDATPILANRFVEPTGSPSSPRPLPPPNTTPPSSSDPPPLIVAPPPPLADGVWQPPAL